MSNLRRRSIPKHSVRPIRSLGLVAALVLSAMLTGAGLETPALHWLAWFSLLPLFHAARRLSPSMAAAGGGLWGCTLFLSANAGISSPIESTFGALALLTIVPAVYTGLSAWLRRWTGFHPFLLAFGWILVELALTPLGLARGLLAGTQGENLLADWSGRLLGYVFVAFIVACANASIMAILGSARLRLPKIALFDALPNPEACAIMKASVLVPVINHTRAYPRAPPASHRVC